MNTKSNKLTKMMLTAMFAALVCVATMVIKVPSPTGYANLGDGIILLAAFLLGPFYGAAAAGIGAGLADLIAGYTHYVPGTFLIKAGVAVIAALIFRAMTAKKENSAFLFLAIVSGIGGELFMVAGYFVYNAFILSAFMEEGYGILPAASSIPSDSMQGLAGIILSVILLTIFRKTKIVPET